jgi:hypothetical protein
MPPAATTRRDPVLQWVGYAQQAGAKYGIPTAVLLGLTRVESGGNIHALSSAGAFGLTQFIPSTAAHYGVKANDARSQFEGAARYLHDLGFGKDPVHALNAYNGAQTIGGKANPYAANVIAAAKSYGHLGDLATLPAPSTGDQAAARPDARGGLNDTRKRTGRTKARLTVATVGGGAALVYIGANQASGGTLNRVAKTGAKTAAMVPK